MPYRLDGPVQDAVLRDERLSDSSLQCAHCGTRYPVTEDSIPIMWTRELRDSLVAGPARGGSLAANVSTYDRVSDDYAAHTCEVQEARRRLRTAVKLLTGDATITASRAADLIKRLLGPLEGELSGVLKQGYETAVRLRPKSPKKSRDAPI